MAADTTTVGWVGTGRMGAAMVRRLARASGPVEDAADEATDGAVAEAAGSAAVKDADSAAVELAVWNRTRAKAEALGMRVVDRVADLADREVVFTTVSGSADLADVVTGPDGLLSRPDAAPGVIVDCSSVSAEVSAEVRAAAEARGTAFVAAPVSGNAKVVAAGRLGFAVSGPDEAFRRVEPLLRRIGDSVTYVGDGESARLVKICHNLLLGVVTQSMAEILVLAEKGGVRRGDLLGFINDSVLGSTFTRYKTPALVRLDYAPTFTSELLRKDFDLGLDAARELGAPLPVAALVQQLVQGAIGAGHGAEDFAVLLERQAASAGLELAAENEDAEIDDGLS